MSSVELSIFVVSYNTRELTHACLDSIYRTTSGIDFEVIVVDNASGDDSARMIARDFPQVRLIASDFNLGFGVGNNRARREANGDFFLLLNPDTRVLDDSIPRLLAFARAHPEAGVVGGRVLHEDGSLNPWSCRGRPTPWGLFCQATGLSAVFRRSRLFDPSSLGSWQRDSVREVDVVVGCFFLVTRELWDELEGFDPTFFMYGEETDFCLRARGLGYRPMITPDASIIHHQGASEPVRADKMIRLLAAQATLFHKHWSRPSAAFGVAMLWLWALTRALGGALLSGLGVARVRSAATAWSAIWWRRGEWLSGYPPAERQPGAS